MSSKRGYGGPVNTDEVSAALESTRLLRLAVNVLWDKLPQEMGERPVQEMLRSIHGRINEIEDDGLRRWGHARGTRSITSSSAPSARSARLRLRSWRR